MRGGHRFLLQCSRYSPQEFLNRDTGAMHLVDANDSNVIIETHLFMACWKYMVIHGILRCGFANGIVSWIASNLSRDPTTLTFGHFADLGLNILVVVLATTFLADGNVVQRRIWRWVRHRWDWAFQTARWRKQGSFRFLDPKWHFGRELQLFHFFVNRTEE